MKKLALVIAVAAATTISTGAHAVLSSNITQIDLWVGGLNMEVDCVTGTANSGFTTGLQVSGVGTGNNQVNFLGNVCLDPNANGSPYVALDFGLRGDGVGGATPGVTFDGGLIDIYTDTTTNPGWAYLYSVDASVSAIDCLDNVAGHLGTNTTAGMQFVGGVLALPGLWSGAIDGTENRALCVTTLLGQTAGLFVN